MGAGSSGGFVPAIRVADHTGGSCPLMTLMDTGIVKCRLKMVSQKNSCWLGLLPGFLVA